MSCAQMWYLLLFALVDVASAYVSSTLVGSVEDHLCNGGVWDTSKMEYESGNTLYTSQECANYCSNWIYTRGSYNPGDTIRHYATNRVLGTSKTCFCHYPEFTTNNHCEIQSNQDSNEYYDILYIDTAVICTEGEICTLVQATIQDNAHNNIHTEQNPMALNTGSPSYIFGGVQGGWFKMVRTNGEGVMQETRYIGPHNSPSITDIADLDISKWDAAVSTSLTDVGGETTCVSNRYCVQDFEWSPCTSSTSPLSAPCSYGEECTYGGGGSVTLSMYDSYGDGWNGYKLLIGGTEYTFNSGTYYYRTITDFTATSMTKAAGGSYPGEVSWTLTCNVNDAVLASTSSGNSGTIWALAPCGGTPTCTPKTCPAGKAFFNGECMLPCLIPTNQYSHANGQTLIRPYLGKGYSGDDYSYPTTKDELTQMCVDACTGVTQVPDTRTDWGSGFTTADYFKFNMIEVMDDPTSSYPGRCYCYTYTPETGLAAGITPLNGNTAAYSYYIIDKTSEGCAPAPIITKLDDGKYCSPWAYLDSRLDVTGSPNYPPRLPSSHPLYNADAKIECANRCLADTTSGSGGFYLQNDNLCGCTGLSNNDCTTTTASGAYTTYKITTDSTAPPCVNAVALLTEDCSYSGGICEAGKIYFNDECISESDLCDGGEYASSDGTCINCQAGRFSATGGLSCEACPTGFESNDVHTACVEPSCQPGQVAVQGQVVDHDATIAATPVLVSNVCSNQMTVHELTKMETSGYAYAFANYDDRLKKFAFTHQGYERCPYDNPDNDANSCYGAGANEGNCAGKCSPTAPADCFTICFEKNADSMVLYDWKVESLSYGWKSSAKCYCLNTTLSCGENVALPDSSRKLLKYDFQTVSSGDFVCEDCPAGSYQDQPGIYTTCKNCPSGFYQDLTGQISCETCSVGYIPNAEKTDCSFCAAEYTNYNDNWETGCGPWATVDGCSCICGDSGFTGEHCDVCGKGMGWNATTEKCVPCGYPYVNDQTSHDAECSHDYCPPGQGTTQDEHTWSADNTTENCVQCTGITVSPDYYGQCADVVCEGQTVPKSVIDHTLSITNQANCEECPSDKVKNGIQCVTPLCIDGFPKEVIDQTLAYDNQANCIYCADGLTFFMGACVPDVCAKGTGITFEEFPYILSHTRILGDMIIGVQNSQIVVFKDDVRIALQITSNGDTLTVKDLEIFNGKIAVLVHETDNSQSSPILSSWVYFYTIDEDPFSLSADVDISGDPKEIVCAIRTYNFFSNCHSIAVDGEFLYVGYLEEVYKYTDPSVTPEISTAKGDNLVVVDGTMVGSYHGQDSWKHGIQIKSDSVDITYGTSLINVIDVRDDGKFVAFTRSGVDTVYIWNITEASPTTVEIESDTLMWVGENLVVGNSNGVYMYDTENGFINMFYGAVEHMYSFTLGDFPDSMVHGISQGPDGLKKFKLECQPCVSPYVNDGITMACEHIQCPDAQWHKAFGVDVTLAFDDTTNCEDCYGIRSGIPCLPIECNPGSVLKVNIDNSLPHTDQDNCALCGDGFVSFNGICSEVMCNPGQRINIIDAGLKQDDPLNCEDCSGFTVGTGSVCVDIECGSKRQKLLENIDHTLDLEDINNCGEACSGDSVLDKDNKTQCIPCTENTVPNTARLECVEIVCPAGYKVKSVIDRTVAFDDTTNCEDIDECDPNPCSGECTQLKDSYVCHDDIVMGHGVGAFADSNKHICPHGFVLTTEEPENTAGIADLQNKFKCPDFISYANEMVFRGERVNSRLYERAITGDFRDNKCVYEYQKLKNSIEEFSPEV